MPAPKSEVTRQAIQNIAFELFCTQGYTATSMRQIALGTGISLGSIYNYFGSKEEIFINVVNSRHPFVILLPALNQVEAVDLRSFISRISQSVIDLFEQDPKIINLFMIEVTEFKGRHAESLIHRLLPELQQLAERLHGFREINDRFNDLSLLRTILSMIFGYVMSESLVKNATMPNLIDNSFDTFIEVMMNGVLAHKEG